MKLFGKFRVVFILLTCLSVFSPILAQNKKLRNTQIPVNKPRLAQKCNLPLAQAPALQGIRLGMTPEYLAYRNPRYKEPYLELQKREDENGWVPAHTFSSDDDFRSIPEISYKVEFLDKRISYFSVEYNKAPKDIKQDEFVSKIAEALGVSANWFVPYSNYALMQCIGFTVNVALSGGGFDNPFVSFQDTSATEVLAKRRTEQSKKKRDSFKP
jgi:hypothetical protein